MLKLDKHLDVNVPDSKVSLIIFKYLEKTQTKFYKEQSEIIDKSLNSDKKVITMLKPDKHLDLNISTLKVSAIILKYLKKKRVVTYRELLDMVSKSLEINLDDVIYIITPAINLVFLLGKLDYHPKTDSFEFLG